ncbi:MAG: CPBP family intramembrane glutamic endopeptidase [Xanthobacteraceae bacterium]
MPPTRLAAPAIPLWFVVAFAVMVVSQLARLGQTTPAAWLVCDYAGRLGTLAVLWFSPAARAIAFTPRRLNIGLVQAIAWAIGLASLYTIIDSPLRGFIDATVPGTTIGSYLASHGWLHAVDVTFGLALVAFQEEIYFRRCARAVVRNWLGDGFGMIIATSLLFAAYHWWTGLGNMVTAGLFGIGAMWLYRRAGSIWPVMLAHYLADLIVFA